MNEPERISAGWYPDPLGTTQARWWDGNSWTEHTRNPHESMTASASETIVITPHSGFVDPVESTVATPDIAEPAGDTVKAATPLPSPAQIPAPRDDQAASSPAVVQAASAAAAEPRERQVSSSVNGWLAVNFAINSVGRNSLIRATSEQVPELIIDVGRGIYWCDVALENLPRIIGPLTVKMRPRSKARTPPHAGQDIRPLLWMLGVEIESGGALAIVEPGNRFTLRRTPSLPSIRPSKELMEMSSMLANGYVTPAELAAATKSSLSSAIRLIAFFSFLGLVSELPDVVE